MFLELFTLAWTHFLSQQECIKTEAENSAQWLKDNRLCVAGEKTKLLVLGTGEMRTSKYWDIGCKRQNCEYLHVIIAKTENVGEDR